MISNLTYKIFRAKISFFVLLLVMIILPVLSQHQDPEIERFTKDKALSHNIIEEVFQDEKGFMWFGTYDGLARFDGYSVKYYKYNHLDKNSISKRNLSKRFCCKIAL